MARTSTAVQYMDLCSTVQHCTAVPRSRYSRRKLAGIKRSLTNRRNSRNCRNLQNRNSAASGIAIRFEPKILLKCSMRETGPKYPTIGLDYMYVLAISFCRPNTTICTGTNLRSHSITSSIITTYDRRTRYSNTGRAVVDLGSNLSIYGRRESPAASS